MIQIRADADVVKSGVYMLMCVSMSVCVSIYHTGLLMFCCLDVLYIEEKHRICNGSLIITSFIFNHFFVSVSALLLNTTVAFIYTTIHAWQ